MMTRRDALRTAAAAIAASPLLLSSTRGESEPIKVFELGKLPYDFAALEPSIDEETMKTHHGKHHQAYVTNLNAAFAKTPEWYKKPLAETLAGLKDVPEEIRPAVRNNGGGHWNHTFFWSVMAPAGQGGELKGDLLKAIEESFKSVEEFKKAFSDAAVKRFGSGWAWLEFGKDKPLAISSSPNQDNPLMEGKPAPILGVDVWEHAYYLKYKNLRAKYLEEWWKVVNWDAVAANFAAKKK